MDPGGAVRNPPQNSAVSGTPCHDQFRMRALGIVVALGGAVAVAACLDAGMRPSTGHPPRAHAAGTATRPAQGTATATPTPTPTDPPANPDEAVALVPAVATVAPPAPPDAPPDPPPPIAVTHTSPN